MSETSELKDLRDRLKSIITTQCNVSGCKGCPYMFDGGCSATELDGQIMDIEMKEAFS